MNKLIYLLSFFFILVLNPLETKAYEDPWTTNYFDYSLVSNLIEAINERCLATGTNVSQIDYVETFQLKSAVTSVPMCLFTPFPGTTQIWSQIVDYPTGGYTNKYDADFLKYSMQLAAPDIIFHSFPYLPPTDDLNVYAMPQSLDGYKNYDTSGGTAIYRPWYFYDKSVGYGQTALDDMLLLAFNNTVSGQLVDLTFTFNYPFITNTLITNGVGFVTWSTLAIIDNKIKELLPWYVITNMTDGSTYADYFQKTNPLAPTKYPIDFPYCLLSSVMQEEDIGIQNHITKDFFDVIVSGTGYWTYAIQDNFKFRLAEYTCLGSNNWLKVYENGKHALGAGAYPFFKYYYDVSTRPKLIYKIVATNGVFPTRNIKIHGDFLANYPEQQQASEVSTPPFIENIAVSGITNLTILPWTCLYGDGITNSISCDGGNTGDSIIIYWDINNFKSYGEDFPYFLTKTNIYERYKFVTKGLVWVKYPFGFGDGVMVTGNYYKYSQDYEGGIHNMGASAENFYIAYISNNLVRWESDGFGYPITPNTDGYIFDNVAFDPWPGGYGNLINKIPPLIPDASDCHYPPWSFRANYYKTDDPPFKFTNDAVGVAVSKAVSNLTPLIYGYMKFDCAVEYGTYYDMPFSYQYTTTYTTITYPNGEDEDPVYGEFTGLTNYYQNYLHVIEFPEFYSYGGKTIGETFKEVTNEYLYIKSFPIITNLLLSVKKIADFYVDIGEIVDGPNNCYTSDWIIYVGQITNTSQTNLIADFYVDPQAWLSVSNLYYGFGYTNDYIFEDDGPTFGNETAVSTVVSNWYTDFVVVISSDGTLLSQNKDLFWTYYSTLTNVNYEAVIVNVDGNTWWTQKEIITLQSNYYADSSNSDYTYNIHTNVYGIPGSDPYDFIDSITYVPIPTVTFMPATNIAPYTPFTNFTPVPFVGNLTVTNEVRIQYAFFGTDTGISNRTDIIIYPPHNLTNQYETVTNSVQSTYRIPQYLCTKQYSNGEADYGFQVNDFWAVIKYNITDGFKHQ